MNNKPILIILPGWGGSTATWEQFNKKAEKNFHVICVDLPCFGKEPCPELVWGVEDYANFVKNKLTKIKINKKKILLGHSFGGAIATQLVHDHPEMIDGLILVGAAIIRPNIMIKRKIFAILARGGGWLCDLPGLRHCRHLAKKILYHTASSPDYLNTSGKQREIYKKIIRQDLLDKLPKIKIKTLVIWGGKDKMTPLSHGKKISSLLPNVEFSVIKNAPHGLHHEPYADILYTQVRDWVL